MKPTTEEQRLKTPQAIGQSAVERFVMADDLYYSEITAYLKKVIRNYVGPPLRDVAQGLRAILLCREQVCRWCGEPIIETEANVFVHVNEPRTPHVTRP